MITFLNQVVNPFMKWLLTSPLHGLVSNHYMLITVKGRKSGKLYTTPVEYGHDGEALVIVSSQTHSWWKNLRDNASCTLRIKTREMQGTAAVASDPAAITAAFHAIYPKMLEAQVASLAVGRVAIRITPLAS